MRFLLLAALLLLLSPAAGGDHAPVRRHVLALLDGSGPEPEIVNTVHAVLEMPLNHMGIVVRHHYVRTGPPAAERLEGACAVLVCLPHQGTPPDWLWPWLETEVPGRGLRVILFGELGQLRTPDDSRLNRWLEPFGLVMQPYFAKGSLQVVTELADGRSCTYEADPRTHVVHQGPRSTSPANRAWVTTRLKKDPAQVCHPVVTGPWGGIALDPWAVRTGTDDDDRRWYVDPFLFLREALGLARVPAPDPTVLNGRRMWFMHVDGDGFESLSSVRPNALAAEVMLDEVFRKYQLPFTASVIVRSLTADYDVPEPTPRMRLAREILNLPNVEPASHGVLHTLVWRTEAPPSGAARTGAGGMMWYPSLDHYAYSRVNEVKESIRFINERLLEPPRRCRLMLWTGDAMPPEDAILAAGEMGARNLNGGIYRWDPWYDSVGYVWPWTRQVGGALQVYAGAPNENRYDGFFDTMPSAFGHVAETIRRTGSPRILKPANIYVHYYSAENPVRLRVLEDLIRQFALEAETAPVFASTYVEAVEAAMERAQVWQAPNGWLLTDFGACRTARIDGETRDVDFARSSGLLGSRRLGGSLYLHLAGPEAHVVLADRPPALPHVEQANCLLDGATLDPKGVAATATGHGDRVVVLAGFPPDTPLALSLDDAQSEGRSDASGRVRIRMKGPGTTTFAVRSR